MFSKIKAIKNLRDQAKDIQKQLAQIIAEGTASGGAVRIRVNGNQEVLSVLIDDGIRSDKTKLEQSLKDAFNDAHKKIQKDMAKQMKNMGGMSEMFKQIGL